LEVEEADPAADTEESMIEESVFVPSCLPTAAALSAGDNCTWLSEMPPRSAHDICWPTNKLPLLVSEFKLPREDGARLDELGRDEPREDWRRIAAAFDTGETPRPASSAVGPDPSSVAGGRRVRRRRMTKNTEAAAQIVRKTMAIETATATLLLLVASARASRGSTGG